MKSTFSRIFALFLVFYALNLPARPSITQGWEQIDRTEGIEVFRKAIDGSDVVAFRGIGEIEAPIEKVLWVLLDNSHRTEWVDRLKSSTILEEANRPFEYVVYQEFSLPWPINNRDFVYQAKAEKIGKQIVLNMHSVNRDRVPQTAGVRAELYHSAYRMKPLSQNKTRLEVEIHSDPKGMLPKWLVNLIQKSWPSKTLKGIRIQVKKEFVKNSPLPASATSQRKT